MRLRFVRRVAHKSRFGRENEDVQDLCVCHRFLVAMLLDRSCGTANGVTCAMYVIDYKRSSEAISPRMQLGEISAGGERGLQETKY
jgi:hypothetical protein